MLTPVGGQVLDPAAATVALRALGWRLGEQVLAGATVAELDGTLAVMRDIHLRSVAAQAAVLDRATGRVRASAACRPALRAIRRAA